MPGNTGPTGVGFPGIIGPTGTVSSTGFTAIYGSSIALTGTWDAPSNSYVTYTLVGAQGLSGSTGSGGVAGSGGLGGTVVANISYPSTGQQYTYYIGANGGGGTGSTDVGAGFGVGGNGGDFSYIYTNTNNAFIIAGGGGGGGGGAISNTAFSNGGNGCTGAGSINIYGYGSTGGNSSGITGSAAVAAMGGGNGIGGAPGGTPGGGIEGATGATGFLILPFGGVGGAGGSALTTRAGGGGGGNGWGGGGGGGSGGGAGMGGGAGGSYSSVIPSTFSPAFGSTGGYLTIAWTTYVYDAPVLQYDVNNNIVFYNIKTFVIEHPLRIDKYLVHACLEGPEAGVYYRGSASINNDNKSVDIYLADYVDHIATDFTINLTAKMSDNMYIPRFPCLIATRIIGGKFTVYSDITPCDFNYIVFGKRQTIEVEPMKALTCVKGDKDSPYKWI